MADPFVNGTSVKVWGYFRNSSDALADPTSIVFFFRDPRGQTTRFVFGTDAEVVKDTTGVYYVLIVAALGGRYSIRWESVGVVTSAAEGGFEVKESIF